MHGLCCRQSLIALPLLLLTSLGAAASPSVGDIEFKRGNVVGQTGAGTQRMLAIGDAVYLQDRVSAGAQAFAIIRFEDDNKLAVRPNTRVVVASYVKTVAGDIANIDLQAGGIRGNIRKRDGVTRIYHIDAGDTEVTVDEAQFDLRRCDADCAAESAKLIAGGAPVPADAIGRIAQLHGDSWATSHDDKRRVLTLAAPVYARDRLQTADDSDLVVFFRDGGRISLGRNSSLVIQAMDQPGAEAPRASMEMLTGAMRALTGKLAREQPDNYRITTPVATTGIRGTGFDLYCEGGCQSPAYASAAIDVDAEEIPDGLYSSVWKGSIYQQNATGSHDLGEDEHQFIASATSAPQRLSKQPRRMREALGPRPDRVAGDLNGLQDANESLLVEPRPGLYAHAYGGTLTLRFRDREPVTLQAGYTAFVEANGSVTVVAGAPPFMSRDPACSSC